MTWESVVNPVLFGRHLLLERINVGGMAEVFRAKSFGVEGFERMVAVKRILPQMAEDTNFIRMFIDEARIASQLTHHNIVQIYELGLEEDVYFIAMEFVTGRDLRAVLDRLKRQKRLMPEPMACFIIAIICEALDYAHRKTSPAGQPYKIIHRDVSPQNVLLSYEGEVKLCDFGIAKAVNQSQRTQAGVLKGKFAYMSPEQVKGETIDHRSDLFALGVIFYEMLTGQRLFLGESDFSTLEAVRAAQVPNPSIFNKGLPSQLGKILSKMLARTPIDRYQDASQIFDDLQEYLVSSQKLYHAHHLRQFMQTQYVNEIETENAKLKRFLELKAPFEMGRTNNEEPAEIAVVSALRKSTEHDYDSADTADTGDLDVHRISQLHDSSSTVLLNDHTDNLVQHVSEHAIQPDEFNNTVTVSEELAAAKATITLVADGAMNNAGNVTVYNKTGGSEFSGHDEDCTLGEEASSKSGDLQAEINAAQTNLLECTEAEDQEHIDPLTRSKGNSQVAEFQSHLPSNATASSQWSSGGEVAARSPQANERERGEVQARTNIGVDVSLPGKENGIAEGLSGSAVVRPVIVGEALLLRDVSSSSVESEPRNVDAYMVQTDPKLERIVTGRALPAIKSNTPPSQDWATDVLKQGKDTASGATFFVRAPKILMGTAVVVAVIFLLLVWGSGSKAVATLMVDSTPIRQVKIFIDGVKIGNSTPLVLDEINRGTHEIRIEAEGFRTYRQSFEILEYRPHTLEIPLIKITGGSQKPRGEQGTTITNPGAGVKDATQE